MKHLAIIQVRDWDPKQGLWQELGRRGRDALGGYSKGNIGLDVRLDIVNEAGRGIG